MPTVSERPRRRKRTGSDPGLDMIYLVDAAADEVEAETVLAGVVPTTVDGLRLKGLEIEEIGNGIWEATANYSRAGQRIPAEPEIGSSEYEFDTTGESVRIFQAPVVASGPGTDWPAALFGSAINVTVNGREIDVGGVDVVVPAINYAERHIVAAGDVDLDYVRTLISLTGTVNNASFKGFAAGELLFLGARGRRRSADDWEIQFLFRGSKNRTDYTVGDFTAFAKDGWDYVHVLFGVVENATTKMLVKKPIAYFVHRVYDRKSFASLGIGT